MLVGLVTYIVITFAQIAKVKNFVKDQSDDLILSHERLIQSFVIANYADGTDAFVLKEPLFQENFTSNDESFKLNFNVYNYVTLIDNAKVDSLAFVITDLTIGDENAYLDGQGRPIIDAKLYLSDPIVYNGRQYYETQETFVWFLDLNIGLFLVNYDIFIEENYIIDIEGIEISYRLNEEASANSLLVGLGSKNEPDKMVAENNRDITSIHYENINLASSITGDSYINNELIYYDEGLTKLFNRYNYVYINYIGILVVFLIPITYFIFFHKHLKRKYAIRKNEKEKELNVFIENLNKDNHSK